MGREERSELSVLLVESDPVATHLFKKSLEDDQEYPTVVDDASNLDEAIAKLESQSYHMILVEADLEDERGLSLLEEINRYKLDIPFILMTSVRDDRLVREAMNQGVSDLIVKGESHFQELAQTLRKSYEKYYGKRTKPPLCKTRRERGVTDLVETSKIVDRKGYPTSIQDELTGLYSHSYLHSRVVREFSSASRYGHPVSCLMLDIDHFKIINEEKGYEFGDALLIDCAKLLFENCRLSDFAARYGGEEFAVLLPHIDYEGAQELSNRLRSVFAEHMFLIQDQEVNITVSLGISSYPEDSMEKRAELMTYASQALYRSKAMGRNCVTRYKDIVPTFVEGLPSLKISEEKVVEFQRRMSEISNTARRAYIDASKTLIMALENKDRFTAGHATSCAKYSIQVAETLGMSIEEAEIVQHAALLHDIGKVCIPDNILLKPARLSFLEFEKMKQHPYLGYKILKPIKFLQEEAILVLHHHEWYNGEGYPCRLKGNEIPLGARVVAVIDTYDTMRLAGGRYKATATVEDAVNELIAYANIQFDSHVVKAFVEVLKSRGELRTDAYHKEELEKALQNCPSV